MPKIPVMPSNAAIQTPALSPSAISAPQRAMAQVGEQITSVASYTLKVFESIKEAQRKVKATELELDINQGFKDAALSYQTRTDFEKFENDAENIITEIEAKYNDAVEDDPRLKQAIDIYFKKTSSEFMNTVRMKAVQETINRGRGALQSKINQTLDDYASSQSDEERNLIRTKLSGEITSYAESKIISFKEAENEIELFDNTSEDVRADRVTEVDPYKAEEMLRAGEFELDPTKTRDKIEKAQRRQKQLEKEAEVAEKERKKKEKEALKVAHDDEEREIGNQFITGNYQDVYNMVLKSELLTGDEKKTWVNAIETNLRRIKVETEKARKEAEKINPILNADAIVTANDMIRRGVSPFNIRNFVIRNPYLAKEDKEQYINKLEADLSSEMNEGRKTGYRDIYDLIIPKRGPEADLLETPLETQRVKFAQIQLDDWIDEQIKNKKYPTKREIRQKALQLAEENQVTIVEQIEYTRKWGAETSKAVKEYMTQKKK